MGTYGFAQFQIDVKQADEDLRRAIDDFKNTKNADKQIKKASTISKSTSKDCEKSKE